MTSSVFVCAVSLALTCLLTVVTSSPQPAIALSKMEPDHACLFICQICFPGLEDTGSLIDCSNKVCGPMMSGVFLMDQVLWLGNACRQFDTVEKMWHGMK